MLTENSNCSEIIKELCPFKGSLDYARFAVHSDWYGHWLYIYEDVAVADSSGNYLYLELIPLNQMPEIFQVTMRDILDSLCLVSYRHFEESLIVNVGTDEESSICVTAQTLVYLIEMMASYLKNEEATRISFALANN